MHAIDSITHVFNYRAGEAMAERLTEDQSTMTW